MALAWAKRIAFGLVASAACGGFAVLHAPGDASHTAQAQDVATPAAPLTQGQRPGGAFLMDLSAGWDQQTQYLSDFDFAADWIEMSFRDENIVFDATGMQLNAVKVAGEDPAYTAAEFQRRGFYGYGRYEVVMRASDAPGSVSSFFLHTAEQFGDPHSEIDVEFLGRSPRQVHLNYFVGGRDDSGNVELWFDASKAWHLYAFDWAPDSIRWYVDGRQVRETTSTTSPIGIPANSGRVIANIWTGNRTSEEWVGRPQFDQASAFYLCISHVPVGQSGRQCSDTFAPAVE